jgi:hypothetical protein
MLLRDHPLLTHQNIRTWPPAWLYCVGFDNTYPLGEVGILKTVFVSAVKPSTRCFLIIEHAGAEYMGELSMGDAAFCNEIYQILLRHCGETIQEIGDIDLIERTPEQSTQESTPLFLRHHPLMSYHGVPNWPPTWTWIGGLENKFPRGEIGIFKSATLSQVLPANKCYLYIDHEGSSYIGCLLFDDHGFCRQLAEILQFCCNRSIAEIGGLDLSHTL